MTNDHIDFIGEELQDYQDVLPKIPENNCVIKYKGGYIKFEYDNPIPTTKPTLSVVDCPTEGTQLQLEKAVMVAETITGKTYVCKTKAEVEMKIKNYSDMLLAFNG